VSVIRHGFGQNHVGKPGIVLAAFSQHFGQRFREGQQLKGCMSMQEYTGVITAVQAAAFERVWMKKEIQTETDNTFLCCYYNSEIEVPWKIRC
jgi:hypothetical protein